MALIVDAGALYAQADRTDPYHEAVARLLQAEAEPLVTSQIALAEADYLILSRLGIRAELSFLEDLAGGTFVGECLTRDELDTALQLSQQYRALELGLADASLIVLAARHRTRRVLTLNERDFRAVVPLQGGAFTLLPADS